MTNSKNHSSQRCFKVHLVQPLLFARMRPRGKETQLIRADKSMAESGNLAPMPCASHLSATQVLFICYKISIKKKIKFHLNLFHSEANLKYSCRDLIDAIKKLITPYSQGKWSVTRSCAENQIHITPNEHPAPLSRVLRFVGSLRALTPEGRRGRFWGCLVSPKCKMPGLTFCQSFAGLGRSTQDYRRIL